MLLRCLAAAGFALPLVQEGAPAPKEALLLRGAVVHSMLPGDPPQVLDVRIEDGRIRAVGPEALSGSEPRVLELAGKHLVPGLIDGLVNFDPEHDALYLAAGVTLVGDVGSHHYALSLERASERRERVPGPALLTSGAPLDGDPPATATSVVLRTADAAEAYLPILFEENVDYLTFLPGLPEPAWKRVLELAHAQKLAVFGPRLPGLTLEAALAAGQDGFHALDALLPAGVLWDKVEERAWVEASAQLARAQKVLVPLLRASAVRLEDQAGDPARKVLAGLLAPSYEAWWEGERNARSPFLAPERRAPGELALAKQARCLKALFDAGARLLPGSGAPQPWLLPGTALHQELEQWVHAGIPTASVLELATRGAAEALGLAGERGTIQGGAWADLLVLDEDPTADLAHLLDPAWVILRGRPLDRSELAARLDELGKRQAALRAELQKPVEVAPPPQGQEGIVLLEGTVQSESYGSRLSTERYRIVRVDNEVLLFTSRLAYPPDGRGIAKELTLEQFVRNGRLEQVHASLKEGASTLEHDGLWTADSWRMQTRLDGQIVSSAKPLREQPVCVDAGSVSAFLILGQVAPAERIPVVEMHPGFDVEPVNWSLAVDDDGDRRVRTNMSMSLYRLDEHGALASAVTKVGNALVTTRSLSTSAFGGAGLPIASGSDAARRTGGR